MGFWGNFSAAASQLGHDLGEWRRENIVDKQNKLEQERQQKLLEMAISRDAEDKRRWDAQQARLAAQDVTESTPYQGSLTPEAQNVLRSGGMGYRIGGGAELEGPTPDGSPLMQTPYLTPTMQQQALAQRQAQETWLFNQQQEAAQRAQQMREWNAANPNATMDQGETMARSLGLDWQPTARQSFNMQKQLAGIRYAPDPIDPSKMFGLALSNLGPALVNSGMDPSQLGPTIAAALKYGQQGATGAAVVADPMAQAIQEAQEELTASDWDKPALLRKLNASRDELQKRGVDPNELLKRVNALPIPQIIQDRQRQQSKWWWE